MKFRTFVFVVVLFAFVTACKKQEAPPPAADKGTQTGTPTDTGTGGKPIKAALAPLAFPANGSMIEIDFTGAISHILRTDGKPMRSVLIADAGHKAKLVIFKPAMVKSTDADSETAIATAIGGSPTVVCDKKSCVVTKLPPVVIRIRDAADKPIAGSLTTGPDFDYLVPHMQTAAKVTTLDPDLLKPAPTGDFTNFFELDGGGNFTARPFCAAVGLDPDNESRPDRLWASKTTLRGTTDQVAHLEFSDDGSSWRKLEFTAGKYILLQISNDPTDMTMPHFNVHEKIADGSVANYPTLKATISDCIVSTAVGCGNTQWP